MNGKMSSLFIAFIYLSAALNGCKKKPGSSQTPASTFVASFKINGSYNGSLNYSDISTIPVITYSFSDPVKASDVTAAIRFNDNNNQPVPFSVTIQNSTTVQVQPLQSLKGLTNYSVTLSSFSSLTGSRLSNPFTISFATGLDLTDKFPRISDSALLDLVQKQTFSYFWDFGHPVSGLARERNSSGETVTTGGSGFGIMTIVTAVSRNFITRVQGLARLQIITGFLKNTAKKFHGAFPHWMNGTTGEVIPFSPKDDGADLVETSYLMEGLLIARQFFNGSSPTETSLRNDINTLWNNVEWSWFRKDNANVLYWHWSPDFNWDMNFPVTGWNEALITYVLAASSPAFSIPKTTYDSGWALNGAIRNGKTFYNIQLPLGPDYGGPLFFSHYSFLGINPDNLTDAYANYGIQTQSHSLINFTYCKTNPHGFAGYSDSCWGLTSSDDVNGYAAHSPTSDDGVITPAAAISSLPYTPSQSMQALRFFYYKLGDKIWGQYGFTDAFSLSSNWFATSSLAIDEGPIVGMIENYRSGLLWNLFMSCPEIKTGMHVLGFQSPNL